VQTKPAGEDARPTNFLLFTSEPVAHERLLTAHCPDLPAKQVHDQGQDDADEDAGPQREVKAEISPLETEVPRQLPQPGKLRGQQEHRPHDHQDYADHDQQTA
jgi:hypothetical protein